MTLPVTVLSGFLGAGKTTLLEFADVVVIDKCDLAEEDDVTRVEAIVRILPDPFPETAHSHLISHGDIACQHGAR